MVRRNEVRVRKKEGPPGKGKMNGRTPLSTSDKSVRARLQGTRNRVNVPQAGAPRAITY
jgi:hypothetical protein